MSSVVPSFLVALLFSVIASSLLPDSRWKYQKTDQVGKVHLPANFSDKTNTPTAVFLIIILF